MTTSAAPKKKTKSKKRKLYDLHTWLGFHLAALMSLILLTGTFAVIADEIDWLIQADMRVTPSAELVSWDKLEKAVHAYAPDDGLLWLMEGEGDYFAYRALMMGSNGKPYNLYVNQWSGQVTGVANRLTVQRFLRDLHRYLFMPSIIGLPIVCSMALVLAFSLYTGLKTTRKWRKVAVRIRTDKGNRIAIGDFHKAAGIWAIWFFVMMIVTSVWYLFEWGGALSGHRFEPDRPGVSQLRSVEFGSVIQDADAATLLASAKAAYPNLRPTDIMYASAPRASVIVLGRTNDIFVRDRANRVFLDPVSAEVIKVQKSGKIGMIAYLNELADPLHFGSFGGLLTKVIWFIFGLAMSALSLTGVWLTWKRLKTASLSRVQIATLPIIVITIVFGFSYVQRFIAVPVSSPSQALEQQYQQGLQAKLHLILDEQAEFTGQVRLEVSAPNGRPNILYSTISIEGQGKSATGLRPRRIGNMVSFSSDLPIKAIAAQQTIIANIHLGSGDEVIYQWSVK